MATAYESDSEAAVVPVSVIITSPAGAMSSVSSAVDGGVSCIQGKLSCTIVASIETYFNVKLYNCSHIYIYMLFK